MAGETEQTLPPSEKRDLNNILLSFSAAVLSSSFYNTLNLSFIIWWPMGVTNGVCFQLQFVPQQVLL